MIAENKGYDHSMTKSTHTTGSVSIGDRAPDFTLRDQNGQPVHLADLIGKATIVLYFYPKDFSGGCTAEACSFRDNYEVFKQAGAMVIGVSSDTEESHAGFAQKHRLPFTLLSDPNAVVQKVYGVPNLLGIVRGRVTYVIDQSGTIRHTFSALIDGPKHVAESLRIIRELVAQPT